MAGEEIAGLDITKESIKVSQVSQDKDEKWEENKDEAKGIAQDFISDEK